MLWETVTEPPPNFNRRRDIPLDDADRGTPPSAAAMTDSSITRITGMFGVACVLLSWAQFPLWVIGGAPSVDTQKRPLIDTSKPAIS